MHMKLTSLFLLLTLPACLTCGPLGKRTAAFRDNRQAITEWAWKEGRVVVCIQIAGLRVLSVEPTDDLYPDRACSDGRIWVSGAVVKGRIYVNEALAGHELAHLLSWKDTRFIDPDLYR